VRVRRSDAADAACRAIDDEKLKARDRGDSRDGEGGETEVVVRFDLGGSRERQLREEDGGLSARYVHSGPAGLLAGWS